MNHFPVDTRNQNKSNGRDSLNFPQTLPTAGNSSFSEYGFTHTPNYDRNMFSNPVQQHVEIPQRNMMNDRLFETSQIYRNFGNNNSVTFQQSINHNQPVYSYTRERRDEKPMNEESRNMDRIFMNSRNYDQEVNERLNGFGIIPKDTRFESSAKKSGDSQMELRSNRYLGLPGNNI